MPCSAALHVGGTLSLPLSGKQHALVAPSPHPYVGIGSHGSAVSRPAHLENKCPSGNRGRITKKTLASVRLQSSISNPAQRQAITVLPHKCGGAEASPSMMGALWAHSSFAGVNKLSVWPLIQ